METTVQQVKPLVKLEKSSRRVYKDSKGNKLPGVTTVQGILAKPVLINWAAKEERLGILNCIKNNLPIPEKYFYNTISTKAADIGTICHFMCECYLKNLDPDLSEFPPEQVTLAKNGFKKFLEFWEPSGFKVLHTELQLVSNSRGFAGTIDIICEDKEGGLILLDLKTSKSIYSDYIVQMTAYSKLWSENNPERPFNRHIIVRIGKEIVDDLEVREENDLGIYWEIFEDSLRIYKNQKKIKDL